MSSPRRDSKESVFELDKQSLPSISSCDLSGFGTSSSSNSSARSGHDKPMNKTYDVPEPTTASAAAPEPHVAVEERCIELEDINQRQSQEIKQLSIDNRKLREKIEHLNLGLDSCEERVKDLTEQTMRRDEAALSLDNKNKALVSSLKQEVARVQQQLAESVKKVEHLTEQVRDEGVSLSSDSKEALLASLQQELAETKERLAERERQVETLQQEAERSKAETRKWEDKAEYLHNTILYLRDTEVELETQIRTNDQLYKQMRNLAEDSEEQCREKEKINRELQSKIDDLNQKLLQRKRESTEPSEMNESSRLFWELRVEQLTAEVTRLQEDLARSEGLLRVSELRCQSLQHGTTEATDAPRHPPEERRTRLLPAEEEEPKSSQPEVDRETLEQQRFSEMKEMPRESLQMNQYLEKRLVAAEQNLEHQGQSDRTEPEPAPVEQPELVTRELQRQQHRRHKMRSCSKNPSVQLRVTAPRGTEIRCNAVPCHQTQLDSPCGG